MCGRTGFKRYQVHADCWPASEVFTGGSTQLFVSVAAVDLKVCASNLPGKLVYASLWRGPVSGYPEHSWLYSKQATSTCVWFYNMDGAGNTFAGVYYNTVASLRAIPANIASMQRSSCAAATGTTSPNGNKLFCDRRSR